MRRCRGRGAGAGEGSRGTLRRGWVRPGAAGGAALALGAVAALAACGEVRLVDPTVTGVDLSGMVYEVRVRGGGEGGWLEFRGFSFGLEPRGADMLVRYLDAGAVVVGGRPAERRFVRPGEPEYALRAPFRGAQTEVTVRVAGSAVVPGCTLGVALPVARLPEDGGAVARGADLVVPVPALPDTLPATDRVTGWAELAGGGARRAGPVSLAAPPALVVPAAFLGGLPPGEAELALEVRWERTVEGGACAPAVTTTAAYRAVRTIQLR